jgi:NAD(P)H-hydrate epimerase
MMREIDRRAQAEFGIPGRLLLERAGEVLARDVMEHFDCGNVLVLAGRGNNGGDGTVAARYLSEAGWRVRVVLFGEPSNADAADSLRALPSAISLSRYSSPTELAAHLAWADVVVDALLGTGSRLPLEGTMLAVVRQVNETRLPVVAADLPTGLDPDDGTGESVLAFRTVTFGLPKRRMVTPGGLAACGSVRVEPLLFPPELLREIPRAPETTTLAEARELLPRRPTDGHKGTFGRVRLFAGSKAMPGAAVLAGFGALRSGVGLVEFAAPSSVHAAIATHLPEAILGEPRGVDFLQDLHDLPHTDAIVVGPGVTPAALPFVRGLLKAAEATPIVVDADALHVFADGTTAPSPRTVVTPHPGEAARLLGTTAADIQANRWGALDRLIERLGCVVVLKGSGTLVGGPDGRRTHIPSGNSALARGGTGDVLAGLLGGLLAQGMTSFEAAVLGSFVLGLAADLIVKEVSARGVLVREIADQLPAAWRAIERGALPMRRRID